MSWIFERYKDLREMALDSMDKNINSCHDRTHILRVEKNAILLSEGIFVDDEILFPAVWMHDIKRSEELQDKSDHALASAERAVEILYELGYFPEKKINKVGYCISVHRYSDKIKPETIEAWILQDSDRLDAIGISGIMRTFSFDDKRLLYHPSDPFCENGRELNDKIYTLDHFYQKLLLLEGTFNTKKANVEAKKRIMYMKEFLEKLKTEIK